jgi:predicted TIM-barrel fold metal-dependent hydrolase
MMQQKTSSRREFLGRVPYVAAAFMAESPHTLGAQQPVRVPWSAGIEAPQYKAPANAADCHHHIYDSRFPVDPRAQLRPGNATVADYRLLQRRIGIVRHVVVQPSTYGTDNRCLLDALRQFGLATTRGIAVVNRDISNTTLAELQAAGVCGIRFNLIQAGATTLDMVEPLAKRVAALGWHIQVNATPEQILAGQAVWTNLPIPVVFDHLGHAVSTREPVFGAIVRLLQGGKCWIKLSGVYIDSKVGPPAYSDSAAVAKAYIQEAPERLVWGTDWPHPTAHEKPDDALLFDLLARWSPNKSEWHRILVDNPAVLYGFS